MKFFICVSAVTLCDAVILFPRLSKIDLKIIKSWMFGVFKQSVVVVVVFVVVVVYFD